MSRSTVPQRAAEINRIAVRIADLLSEASFPDDRLTATALIVLVANATLEEGIDRERYLRMARAYWDSQPGATRPAIAPPPPFVLDLADELVVLNLQRLSLQIGAGLSRLGLEPTANTRHALRLLSAAMLRDHGLTRKEYERLVASLWDNAAKARREPQ